MQNEKKKILKMIKKILKTAITPSSGLRIPDLQNVEIFYLILHIDQVMVLFLVNLKTAMN